MTPAALLRWPALARPADATTERSRPGVEAHLVAIARPASWEAEQYRALRHAIEALGERAHQVVAVTSPSAGDGKTTTAINLAAALSDGDARHVLLIDADLRCGGIASLLGLANQAGPGLAGAIADPSLELDDVVRSVPLFLRFSVLPASPRPATAHELVESPRLRELLDQARRRFDRIVVDTPPSVPITDCQAIARAVDGFVMVVGAHRTSRRLLEEALDRMEPAKLYGLVFNGDDAPVWRGLPRYYGTNR